MTYIQALILGTIQGFSEPIPISSSAQTRIASLLMGIDTPGIIFEVFLNFASFLAILYLTRRDVSRLLRGFLNFLWTRDQRHGEAFQQSLFVLVGTLPVLITGFAMQHVIDQWLSGPLSIAIFLSLTGFMLFWVRKRNGDRSFEAMTFRDAMLIGTVQGMLAVIPGISRSGATIVTALALGLTRETAFRFSFLLYLPIGFGSMLLGAKDLVGSAQFQADPLVYGLAFFAALPATLLGYRLLKSAVESGRLIIFSLYCWLMSGLLLLS